MCRLAISWTIYRRHFSVRILLHLKDNYELYLYFFGEIYKFLSKITKIKLYKK